jgi:hypothetical protein
MNIQNYKDFMLLYLHFDSLIDMEESLQNPTKNELESFLDSIIKFKSQAISFLENLAGILDEEKDAEIKQKYNTIHERIIETIILIDEKSVQLNQILNEELN